MIFYRPNYFLAIVEAGGLTRAAEQLYVSQPSLSQYLKRLESNLGVDLFDHSSSPLRLTYVGERYYHYVKQHMALNETVQKEFQDIKSHISGRIRLGVTLWRGSCILPDVFPEFHQKYPGIRIELTEGRSVQLMNALMNDAIDIAVVIPPESLDYSKLVCDVILEERILLAAPTNHPRIQELLRQQPDEGSFPIVPLEILSYFPLILAKTGQRLPIEVKAALERRHIEPDVLLETENLTTAINLVATGVACTFVPEEGSRVCKRPGQVSYLLTDDPKLVWPLAVVYRKDIYLTHICKLLIESLTERLSKKNKN